MSFGQRNLDRQKPEIEFPENGAPTELVVKDLIEGHGAQVVPGSRVLAHYVGVAFSTGEEFDASWNRNEPLPFQVGVGQVIRGWDAVTKGAYGLSGIPAPEILGLRLLVAEDHYQLDLVVLAVTLFVVFRIRSSHLGNVLAAVGSDEIASRSLGLRTRGYKALAYALAAFFAGMAGALLAHQYNYLDPTVFTVQMSVLVLTIVVLGGINSPFGAVLGSLALVGLPEALRLAPDVRILLYGIVVIAIIRFLPQGLWTRSA